MYKFIGFMIRKSSRTYNQQFREDMSEMAKQNKKRYISFGELTSLLAEHQIKFFSKEDVSKINKLFPSTFHTVALHQILSYLELACLQYSNETKIFIVKVRGKMLDTEAFNQVGKKRVEQHHIHYCLKMIKNLLMRLYGKQAFWFRALGGVANTNTIKLTQLHNKIHKLLKNSSHSTCIERLFIYLSGSDPQNPEKEGGQVFWQDIRTRLNPSVLDKPSLNKGGKFQQLKPKPSTSIDNESMRISTFQSLQDYAEKSQIPFVRYHRQSFKRNSRTVSYNFDRDLRSENKKCRQKRLLNSQLSKIPVTNISLQKQQVIHSNSFLHHKFFGAHLKSRSSCKNYQ